MSEHHLPPDSREWPRDPFALLGVAAEVDRREFRQAYVKLIKNFKPEHFPQEFRLIREAYESGLRRIEWRELIGKSSEDAGQDTSSTERDHAPRSQEEPQAKSDADALPRSARGHDSEDPDGHANERNAPFPPPKRPEAFDAKFGVDLPTQLEQLWNLGCEGGEVEAYRRLGELERTHRGNEEIALRLYWLLWSDRRLDTSKAPIDWLTLGLRGGARGPRIRRLFVLELEQSPEQAFRSGAEHLLQRVDDPQARWEVASARWRAAARLERGDRIEQDIEELRPKLQIDEAMWQGLLFEAVEQLAWSTATPQLESLKRYWRELQQLDALRPGTAAQLDRLEFLLQLTEEWRTLVKSAEMPAELSQSVLAAWIAPEHIARKAAEDAARVLNRDGRAAIAMTDRLRKISPALLAQLRTTLGRLQRSTTLGGGAEDDREFLANVIGAVLWRNKSPEYSNLRLRLLDLCLQEMIAPEELATLLESTPDGRFPAVRSVADRLRHDLSVGCVFAAHAAYCS